MPPAAQPGKSSKDQAGTNQPPPRSQPPNKLQPPTRRPPKPNANAKQQLPKPNGSSSKPHVAGKSWKIKRLPPGSCCKTN
jgi:hypothetical protein